MTELQKKNADLEQKVAAQASPDCRRPADSPVGDRDRASPLAMTPEGSPRTKKPKRQSNSGRRYSLISLEGTGRRNSITASSKASRRRSVACDAFAAGMP